MQQIPKDIHAFCHRHRGDNVTPKPLNADDIKLLDTISKEMRTQDTVGNRRPRYWAIMDMERIYGVEDGYRDGCEYLDKDSEVIAKTSAELADYLKEQQKNGALEGGSISIRAWDDTVLVEDDYNTIALSSSADFKELYEEYDVYIRPVGYVEKAYIVPNTFFFTQEEAWEHLKKNYYHYSDEAHPYAMTVWRAPLTEGIFNILEDTDWASLAKGGATD